MSNLTGVLILWDIDGTLVTHAPSARDRHAHAVSTVLSRPIDPMPAGVGKTDRQILIELFADHIPLETEIEHAFAVLDAVTVDDMERAPSMAIGGTDLVLDHLSSSGATHTVLTGNTPARARIKLQAAALADHFDFDSGFYGHLHSTRMELVADAAERLSLQPGTRPVIIGDTPLDIIAGHASGIPVIAVATGIFSAGDLAQHNPHALIDDYEDAAMALAKHISAACER